MTKARKVSCGALGQPYGMTAMAMISATTAPARTQMGTVRDYLQGGERVHLYTFRSVEEY